MNRKREATNEEGCAGCFIVAAYLVIFFIAGGWCVNYLLLFFGANAIPFLAAGAIGMIVGPLVVTITLVVMILHAFHAI